jgi:hypothetical protein
MATGEGGQGGPRRIEKISLFVLAVFLTGLAALVWLPGHIGARDQVTVYTAMGTPEGLIMLRPTTYKTVPEAQTVVVQCGRLTP